MADLDVRKSLPDEMPVAVREQIRDNSQYFIVPIYFEGSFG